MAKYKFCRQGKSPMRIYIRALVRYEDPMYAGQFRWFAGYKLEASGQYWMDFAQFATFAEAQACALDLLAFKWFPDLTMYRP